MTETGLNMKIKKRKNPAVEGVLQGLREAVEIAEGRADPSTYRVHVPDEIDVKRIRTSMGLSQAKFAERFGFQKSTLIDWEQRRRRPQGPARVLLAVIERDPEAVLRALGSPPPVRGGDRQM